MIYFNTKEKIFKNKIFDLFDKYLLHLFNNEGKELGAHLNGDESMAFGAGFQAANLSHSFKVRPVWLFDGFPFAFKLVM